MQRWPLHPVPLEAESLASWLRRIGSIYHCGVHMICQQLVGRQYNYIELERHVSEELFQALHGRTGVSFSDMRNRTHSELVQPESVKAFSKEEYHSENYLKRHSILCSLENKLRPSRGPNHWPWRNSTRGKWPKACLECAQIEPFYRRIHWSFPFLMTCPIHGNFLSPLRLSDNSIDDKMPRKDVPEKLLELDRLTYGGILRGTVTFNGTEVAISCWLSILRNLIAELSLDNLIPRADKLLLDHIWRQAGGRPQNPYRTSFEIVKFSKQIRYMHAAAVALDMIATGEIAPAGDHAYLLQTRDK